MSKMRFPLSVVLAINEMERLRCGQIDGAPRPCWCNYMFFSDIEPLPIKRMERVERQEDRLGYWYVRRVVNFYRYHKLIAVVHLSGKKIDTIAKTCGMADTCEADTVFWRVSAIEYAPQDDTPDNQWMLIDMPDTGMNSGKV